MCFGFVGFCGVTGFGVSGLGAQIFIGFGTGFKFYP